MPKFKVVILDAIMPLTQLERELFGAIDASVVQYSDAITPERIVEVAADADAVLTVGARLNAQALAGLKKLKVIGRYGAGFDNVDTDAATERGVVVAFAPVYCQKEVATLTITLLLACERRLIQADQVVKGGEWHRSVPTVSRARSLTDKTMGILGFGGIAREEVPVLQALGVRVITHDPYIDKELCEKMGVELVGRETLLRTSDYICLHIPLTNANRHLLSKPEFDIMKDGVIIINTARGGLIDQAALVDALRSGKVAAAGLDVLEVEPPDPKDPIFSLPNVITSGHIGAATIESCDRLRRIVDQGVVDVLTGKWPQNIANPAIRDKLALQ